MQPADLLIEARWIIPIDPEGSVLEHHALVAAAGRILEIGPSAAMAAKYRPLEHVQRPNHALLPGLVNAHTRAATALLRGVAVRGPLMPWLLRDIRPLEHRWLGPEFVREGARLASAEMLLAGITTFADMYPFPEETLRVASAAHLRVVVGLPVSDTPSAWAQSATEHLERAEQLWDAYRSDPRVRLYFAPDAPWEMSADTLGRVRRVADQLDAPIAMHVHVTSIEIQENRARHGVPPLAWLAEFGLLRPGFTAIHVNWLAEGEAELLARSGVAVVHCPQANLRLGSGICPVRELLAAGVDVALGTDGPASAGALDLLAETRTAALLAAQRCAERAPLGALQALTLATLGGARVLGLDEQIGTLEPGKAADMVCIDLSAPACQPVISPAEAIVFGATRAAVSDVWVAGRALVAGHRLLGFDSMELAARAREFATRIREHAVA